VRQIYHHLTVEEGPGKPPRYGTLEYFRAHQNDICHKIDRYKPLRNLQDDALINRYGSRDIDYNDDHILPFSGVAVFDVLDAVALAGPFDIRKHVFHLESGPLNISTNGYAPIIPPPTWASCATIVSKCQSIL
jgi:hypothetical protein